MLVCWYCGKLIKYRKVPYYPYSFQVGYKFSWYCYNDLISYFFFSLLMGNSHEKAAAAFTYFLLLVFPLFPLIKKFIYFFHSYSLQYSVAHWIVVLVLFILWQFYGFRKWKYYIIPNQRGFQKTNNFLVWAHVFKKMQCIVLLLLMFIQYIAKGNENFIAFCINKHKEKNYNWPILYSLIFRYDVTWLF